MSYQTVVQQNQHAHVAMAGLAKTKGVMVNEMEHVEQINMHHKIYLTVQFLYQFRATTQIL